MKKNILPFFTILFFLLLVGCERNRTYNYRILKTSDKTDLVFFEYSPDIVGIDTNTFEVAVHLRMEDMSIGGVDKLPDGGIVFTHHRRTSNNACGKTMYVTDKNYNIVRKVPICASPMSPKVVGNYVMVGSSAYTSTDTEGKHKLQVYDTKSFQLQKEWLVEDDIDAWQIEKYDDDYAYFGVFMYSYNTRKYAYVVEVNLNNLDTTEIHDKDNFFYETGLSCSRQDSILYIVSIAPKYLRTYNFATKEFSEIFKVSQYPEIAALGFESVLNPKIINGYLYAYFGIRDDGFYIYRAKFDMKTFELIDLKKLNTPVGEYSQGPYRVHCGRFYAISHSRAVRFFDAESGNLVGVAKVNLKAQ